MALRSHPQAREDLRFLQGVGPAPPRKQDIRVGIWNEPGPGLELAADDRVQFSHTPTQQLSSQVK